MSGLANLQHIRLDGSPTEPSATVDVIVENDDAADVSKDGSEVTLADGSVIVDLNPSKDATFDSDHSANLALNAGFNFGGIAFSLIREIEQDIESRAGWMDMREEGLKLLGLQIEQPRGDVGNSSAPLEGMSTVRSPALLGACLKFQANARGELLPASGPVKVMNSSPDGTNAQDEWADILEDDMNVYLTQRAPEYYPDTDRMLFYVGFGGSGFKKVYHCPLRRRPVSESVDAADLIVDNGMSDLRNARRITHRIVMSESMVQRMMIAGVYKTASLSQAAYTPSSMEEAQGSIMGIGVMPDNPEDNPRTLYECLTELDLGEHKDGMPLPYKVVVDKDSHEILEVRRNWLEGDPMYMPVRMYVRYPYVEAMGFYCIGLLHIIGNTTKALTAAIREALDAGMFASFPGFIVNGEFNRQETSDFRIPPGGAQRVNTGGGKLSDGIMPVPYKDVTPGLMQLIEMLTQATEKLAGMAEIPVGEGMQNAPVGTVLAIIDQSTKVMDAVHKRLHAAQAEEFRLLKERFLEDPEAFWRHNPNGTTNWDKESFVQALKQVDLVPVADPNTPTHTHRLMKVMALMQLAQLQPQKFNLDAVLDTSLRMIGFSNPDEFLRPQGSAPPPDPKMLELQLKQQELQVKASDSQARTKEGIQRNQMEMAKTQLQAQIDTAELRGKMALEAAKLKHQKTVDGADMASSALEHMGMSASSPPPPPAGLAGAAASVEGQS